VEPTNILSKNILFLRRDLKLRPLSNEADALTTTPLRFIGLIPIIRATELRGFLGHSVIFS
jgi:hypothetical protein